MVALILISTRAGNDRQAAANPVKAFPKTDEALHEASVAPLTTEARPKVYFSHHG
jgi:hypothetical protein